MIDRGGGERSVAGHQRGQAVVSISGGSTVVVVSVAVNGVFEEF